MEDVEKAVTDRDSLRERERQREREREREREQDEKLCTGLCKIQGTMLQIPGILFIVLLKLQLMIDNAKRNANLEDNS